MTDFDPQAWLELGRANIGKLPEGVVLPEPQIDYERYRAVLQRFYDASNSCCDVEPRALDYTDRGQIQGLLAVADEVIALRDGPKWIDWHGGECPVPDGLHCQVRFRNGETRGGKNWNWAHLGRDYVYDIVAYRIVEEN